MDGTAVRGLAARIDAVASGVEADVRALRALRTTDWVGPAATVCRATVDERVAAAAEVLVELDDAAAALRAHAASADAAVAALRAAVAASGVGAEHLLGGGSGVLRVAVEGLGPGAVGSRW